MPDLSSTSAFLSSSTLFPSAQCATELECVTQNTDMNTFCDNFFTFFQLGRSIVWARGSRQGIRVPCRVAAACLR